MLDMKLTKVQNKFIKNRKSGFSLIKGKSFTGKTLASIYRVINLENNYCLFEDDNIVYIASSEYKLRKAEGLYKEKRENTEFHSLFSIDKNRVKFTLVQDMIKNYALKYIMANKINLKLISLDEINKFINLENFYSSVCLYSRKSKVLKKMDNTELLDEILWIKSCNLTREEYSEVERKGRKYRLLKKSYSREAIYELMEIYSSILWDSGFYDKYDEVKFAITYALKRNAKVTHIVADDIECLTKGELDFLNSIYSDKSYSSFVYIFNSENMVSKNSWLVKGRKLKTLGADFKGKTFYFKKEFILEKNNALETFLHSFKYVNLKHRNEVTFNYDNSSIKKEIYLEDNTSFNENELVEINVFNDIAAGDPIEINEDINEKFYLPKSWLERGKETFILHVKGDSMIEKDIKDGDLIVIKKQHIAYNNDIVAASINGEATLKTLKLNGDEPMLVPANSNYKPIYLEGKEVSILGIAIGVIKNNI